MSTTLRSNGGHGTLTEALHVNEIRDYLDRAPKRWHFDGSRMVNNTAVRLRWLVSIASGTLDERINRRAGRTDEWKPWKASPVVSALQRHTRRQCVIKYGRF